MNLWQQYAERFLTLKLRERYLIGYRALARGLISGAAVMADAGSVNPTKSQQFAASGWFTAAN